MRTRLQPDDEASRLAVQLYAQDREAQEQRSAAEAALNEVEVPAEYLHRAELELANRRQARAQRKQALVAVGLAASFAIGIVAFVSMRPASPPIPESFEVSPASRWSLDTNPETRARVRYENGTVRIDVDQFAPAREGNMAGRWWATLRSIDGEKGTRKLGQLTFRARARGLGRVRFRFVDGNRSYVTPAVDLPGDWMDFSLSLSHLDKFSRRFGKESSDGRFDDRLPSSIDEIQIQTGSHVNPVVQHGYVEIDNILLK